MSENLTSFFTWIGNFLHDKWETGVSVLFGAFFGAYFAFLFERLHAKKKEREANISAARQAQFTIMIQMEAVINVKGQILDSKRGDPQRHLTLPPFDVHGPYPRLDITSLGFMLKGEGAQLLHEVMISEYRFNAFLGSVKQRNIRHELMQRETARMGLGALDQATVAILKGLTDSVYQSSDDAHEGLLKSFEKLSPYFKKEFPEVKVLDVKFSEYKIPT
jgi:hypothetical protein